MYIKVNGHTPSGEATTIFFFAILNSERNGVSSKRKEFAPFRAVFPIILSLPLNPAWKGFIGEGSKRKSYMLFRFLE